MAFRALIVMAAVLGVASCSDQPVNRDASVPLSVADNVDIERYLGDWYEIARFENRFQEGCVGVTARYARREDGLISVTNVCRNAAGEVTDTAEGRARLVDRTSNARLEVSFFGPFWGDYWILDLAEDYAWALVGEPSGRYLWILARTPSLPDDVLQARLQTLRDLGYDTDALVFAGA